MGRDLVHEFISPDYRVQVKEVLDNALKGQQTADSEFPLFTKNHQRVEILLNATTRRDGGAVNWFPMWLSLHRVRPCDDLVPT